MIYPKSVKKYNYNEIFIETGTFLGNTTKCAVEAGYKEIITIEFDKNNYENAQKRFVNENLITLYHGDSGNILPTILEDIDRPCTFWLDAHGDGMCPVLLELDAIKNHSIKTHTILIDDIIDFGTSTHQGITVEDLKEKIYSINKKYKISFEDCPRSPQDILVAEIR
jgi:hypothetical protein